MEWDFPEVLHVPTSALVSSPQEFAALSALPTQRALLCDTDSPRPKGKVWGGAEGQMWDNGGLSLCYHGVPEPSLLAPLFLPAWG